MDYEYFYQYLTEREYPFGAIAVSDDGETGYILVGDQWQVWDIYEGMRMYDFIPASVVPEGNIVQFHGWLMDREQKLSKKQYNAGRQYGQQAMASAFRGLIGAAPLVELEQND